MVSVAVLLVKILLNSIGIPRLPSSTVVEAMFSRLKESARSSSVFCHVRVTLSTPLALCRAELRSEVTRPECLDEYVVTEPREAAVSAVVHLDSSAVLNWIVKSPVWYCPGPLLKWKTSDGEKSKPGSTVDRNEWSTPEPSVNTALKLGVEYSTWAAVEETSHATTASVCSRSVDNILDNVSRRDEV